jgi:hypothetical protein
MSTVLKATVVDRASDLLIKALKEAEQEIDGSNDREIKTLYPAQLVLKKIQAGATNLHDPNNQGDMIILTMAGWD